MPAENIDTASCAYQLGFALDVERDLQGLSRAQLAAKADVSYSTVNSLLNGNGGRLKNYDKCYAALGIRPSIKPVDR